MPQKLKKFKKLLEPEYIGDGLYLTDNSFNVIVSVNNHLNGVAYIDTDHIDRVINYLERVKKRLEQ